jgi:hypothetical protein
MLYTNNHESTKNGRHERKISYRVLRGISCLRGNLFSNILDFTRIKNNISEIWLRMRRNINKTKHPY